MERIVKQWADEVLYYYGAGNYGLLLLSGEPIGDEIRAANDEEAIKRCASVSRQHWEKRKQRGA